MSGFDGLSFTRPVALLLLLLLVPLTVFLSRTSLAQLQQSIDRLTREFDELVRRDAALPLTERLSSSAVLALRPWEFSTFKALRRKQAAPAASPAAQSR